MIQCYFNDSKIDAINLNLDALSSVEGDFNRMVDANEHVTRILKWHVTR